MREKIFQLVKRAVELSGKEGLDPNSAIQKVAEENNLNKDFVDRVVASYNTARTVHVLETTPDRTVKFALADPDKVTISRLQARADAIPAASAMDRFSVHNIYDPEVSFDESHCVGTKAASVNPPQEEPSPMPCTVMLPLVNHLEKAAMDIEKGQQIFDELSLEFFGSLSKIGEEIYPKISRDTLGDELNFAKLESQAMAKFGKDFTVMAFDWIAKKAEYGGARAENPENKRMILWEDSAIGERLEASHELFGAMVELGSVMDANKKAFVEQTGQFDDLYKRAAGENLLEGGEIVKNELDQDSTGRRSTKEKKPDSGGSGGAKSPFDDALQSFTSALQQSSDLISSDQLKKMLSDHAQQSEMKNLSSVHENTQRQIILQKLLSSDPVLSNEDPSSVAKAYETLVNISPKVSMDENLTKSILRAMAAQQTLGPFEAEQITRLEGNLRKQLIPLNAADIKKEP